MATSLVRQWLTCDGNATLFRGNQQVYFTLDHTPLGKPCVGWRPVQDSFLNALPSSGRSAGGVAGRHGPTQPRPVRRGDQRRGASLSPVGEPQGATQGHRTAGQPSLAAGVEVGSPQGRGRPPGTLLRNERGSSRGPGAGPFGGPAMAASGHASLFVGHERFTFILKEREEDVRNVDGGGQASLEPILRSFAFPGSIPK